MGSKMSGQYAIILSITLIVLFLDILLFNYFRMVGTYSIYSLVPIDILFVIGAVFLGQGSVREMGFPTWQLKYEDTGSKKRLLISILLGSCIVIVNTLLLVSSDVSNTPWLRFTSFFQPLFISLRAGLTEELLYRFFIFSVVSKFAGSMLKSRTFGIAAGAIVSSILFGLLHQGFYFSFVVGLGLCYIYRNNGLMFAMGVHFLADFIPFTIIYMR